LRGLIKLKRQSTSFKVVVSFLLSVTMVLLSFGSVFAATPTVLEAPTNLVATSGDSHIDLTWSSVTGATSYNVYASLDNITYNLISAPDAVITATTAAYDVTGLTNGSLYYFKTSAANTVTESAYSDVVSKTPSVGTAPVNLGTAGNYAILAESGISTVPNSVITGDIGVSPIAATAITGFTLTQDATNAFSTSTQITGKAYAADYASPTSSNLTTAVGDMGTAYTDAAGRAVDYTELYTGDISGQTLTPGVYKWGTGVLINSDVTLNGGPNDVFIFQIAKGITQAANTRITLSGGAQAKNIFWQSCETVALGTGAHFEGIILGGTNITLGTNASINGRLLAQTAVTLIMSTVVAPGTVAAPPTALQTAAAAVVKAEVTQNIFYINVATLLVNALPADLAPVTEKQDLSARLAVVKAEVTKLNADVDAATLLVNALPADVAPAIFKQDLLARLGAIIVAPTA
jgi:hypothetical protein